MSTSQIKQLAVADVAMPLGQFPVLNEKTLLKTALEEMSKSRLGIACVTNSDGMLMGILTDGDIRRKLLTVQKPFSAFFGDDVIDHVTRSPSTVDIGDSLISAVNLMEEKKIWDLPVVDSTGKLVGLLHLHPVVQALLENG
jgi:CBS domain-containing protein